MKQGLLSVGIGGRESRSGCLDVEKDCSISKFLNRILGLEVHKQNALFQYFSDTFDHLIAADKKEGKYDMGILDLALALMRSTRRASRCSWPQGTRRTGRWSSTRSAWTAA